MKELYEYQNKIKNMNLEELLEELERQAKESQYHKFCSKNSDLEKKCEDKMMLVKLCIIEVTETK